MNLYLTRAEAVEHEILKPLSEGLEDLLPDPKADGTPHTVEDYYDVQAIADEVLELYVFEGGFVYRCLRPDICPSLFWKIAEKHALPADS